MKALHIGSGFLFFRCYDLEKKTWQSYIKVGISKFDMVIKL